MLALLRPPRSLHCPLHTLRIRTRSLSARHKLIPVYVNTWDPSRLRTFQPKESDSEGTPNGQDVEKEAARKVERKVLRDTQRPLSTVLVRRCDPSEPELNHALKRLNIYLGLADTMRNDNHLRVKVWRAYSLAKNIAPNLSSLLSDRAWDVLWATQSIRSRKNPSRELHLGEIYHDMLSAGQSTSGIQRAEYLESLFLRGEKDLALKEWEQDREVSDPGSREDYKPEHLEVGARMHALAGNAYRARDIMNELFDLYPVWDPSIMMAVFRAFTSFDSKQHHNTARAIYLRMKERLGEGMTLERYDSCLVGFLEARELRYAKHVFKDMVEDGRLACDYSPEEVQKVLKRLHLLYGLGTDIEMMTSIALYVLAILPQPWHSEVFGHWMQSATVKQAPEAATQILEMMFQRGSVPETFHFNLLLRNLFKSKAKERELKAENIGWHMIELSRKSSGAAARPKNFADLDVSSEKSRQPAQMVIISKKLQRASETTRSAEEQRKLPPADIITFSLIMRHHANKLQWEHVDYLARCLKELQLPPNATILNVLMENQTRQGKYRQTWETYKSFTNVPEGSPSVFPDGANFRHLWLSLRLALGDHETRNDNALPTPRELLAETIRWWALTRSRWDAERFRIGLASGNMGAVSTLMMHCFSYTKDLPGSLVALHVLRKKFNIFPSNKAADVLQKQVAWVDLNPEINTGQTQFDASKDSFARRMEKMGHVHHILMQNRFKRAKITGDQFAYMTTEERGDLELNILSEFIRVVLKRSHSPEDIEAMIDEAKRDVGLPNLTTGDMDAFSVA